MKPFVFPLLTIGLLALAGCSSRPAAPPPVTVVPVATDSLRITINASAIMVRETIVSRARSRGTAAKLADRRSIVLERALPDTPPALAASCGAHKPGRIVRIVITTDEVRGATNVTEMRFLVDADGVRCPVMLSAADVADGNRSLLELKGQVESQVARR